jgi:uncharacterized protein (TIGR04255 family)
MQQAIRHYSRAPITEAILDLKVMLPENFPLEKLLEIHTRIHDRFPESEPIHVSSLAIHAGTELQVDASQQHSGFLFRSQDGLRIFQATLQGFTFNRLAPYNSWEEFSDDSRNLWEIYKEICKPTFVTRAAIRYINRIDIPTTGQQIKLQEYLKTAPDIAPGLSQTNLTSFFMQLQIPQEDLNCTLVINETLTLPPSPGFISIIFDIDLFRQQVWQIDDEDIWHFLAQLRERKNQVFRESITEKTEELIS